MKLPLCLNLGFQVVQNRIQSKVSTVEIHGLSYTLAFFDSRSSFIVESFSPKE